MRSQPQDDGNVSRAYKPAIVIPAYKRAESLEELLITLNRAHYPGDDHHLVISLEGNSTEAVRRVAGSFKFNHGTVEIVEHREQMGLKKHIYRCISLSEIYGSVILLEDDLTLSPLYYLYAMEALNAYGKSDRVAGISLYAQVYNETAQLPFIPLFVPKAAYFMQLASSWGAVWSEDQWRSYDGWRQNHLQRAEEKYLNELPQNIQKWPATSWKREFNLYLVSQEKYFTYPYASLTSNSSRYGGEHMKQTGNLFEIPILLGDSESVFQEFPKESDRYVSYDTFMEANGTALQELTGQSLRNIEMDLYGTKPLQMLKRKKVVITSRIPEKSEGGYPLYRLPLELNLDRHFPETRDPFFYLCSTDKITSLHRNRWAYAKLASLLGTNRVGTRRFLLNSLFYFINQKFK